MKYLIPMFNCVVFNDEIIKLKKGVKYKIVEMGNKCGIVFGCENEIPYAFDFEENSTNVLKVEFERNSYCFLFPHKNPNYFSTRFMFKSKEIELNLSSDLKVYLNKALICEENVENLKFSHFEIVGDICLIYFEGERNYLLVIFDDEIKFSNYYDECNCLKNEKYFMSKLNDSLNHGLICHIFDGKVETYLAYLDDDELNLKTEFVAFVFLDCVKAKNFNYCNELLCDNLKIKEKDQLEKFFPEFDYFYPLSENKFMLAKKNTLAGIYSFEIENNRISNIHCL